MLEKNRFAFKWKIERVKWAHLMLKYQLNEISLFKILLGDFFSIKFYFLLLSMLIYFFVGTDKAFMQLIDQINFSFYFGAIACAGQT